MPQHIGVLDHIRAMLQREQVAMTATDIYYELSLRGVSCVRNGVSGMLVDYAKRGEFETSSRGGVTTYAWNRDFVAREKYSKRPTDRPDRRISDLVEIDRTCFRTVLEIALRTLGELTDAEQAALHAANECCPARLML